MAYEDIFIVLTSSLLYEMENIELEINDENEEILPLPSTDDVFSLINCSIPNI